VFADADKVSAYAAAAVDTLYRSGKPGNLFDPKGEATRAEVAALLRGFIEAAV
jgi:hypothetical protein